MGKGLIAGFFWGALLALGAVVVAAALFTDPRATDLAERSAPSPTEVQIDLQIEGPVDVPRDPAAEVTAEPAEEPAPSDPAPSDGAAPDPDVAATPPSAGVADVESVPSEAATPSAGDAPTEAEASADSLYGPIPELADIDSTPTPAPTDSAPQAPMALAPESPGLDSAAPVAPEPGADPAIPPGPGANVPPTYDPGALAIPDDQDVSSAPWAESAAELPYRGMGDPSLDTDFAAHDFEPWGAGDDLFPELVPLDQAPEAAEPFAVPPPAAIAPMDHDAGPSASVEDQSLAPPNLADPATPVQPDGDAIAPGLDTQESDMPEVERFAAPLPDIRVAPAPLADGLSPAPGPDAAPQGAPPPVMPAPTDSEPATEPETGQDDTTRPSDPDQADAATPPPQVRTDRLPQLGDSLAPERAPEFAAPDPASDAPAAQPDIDLATLPALRRYAEAFENPQDLPLFAVLLLDEGLDADERANLARLPFPVTFVIDADAPDAQEAADLYRAGGKEVVLRPAAAAPGASAEVRIEALRDGLALLPEAIAVVDRPEGGFQNDRLLAQQVVAVLGEDGHGLVTFDRGLNAGAQLARSTGLGETRLFRVLDAEGENVMTVRRYLDRAVFRAAQVGAAVVLGDASQEETLAGILEWRMEGRSDAVVLAPLSAVLLADLPD